MILKISQFRKNKPELIKSIQNQGIDSLSMFCACTGLPVAAACMFVKEEYPEYTDLMDKKLQLLTEFYGYKGIEE